MMPVLNLLRSALHVQPVLVLFIGTFPIKYSPLKPVQLCPSKSMALENGCIPTSIIYVDWAGDGFNYSQPSDLINVETYKPLPGSDLVYYNCWSADINEGTNTWYNSDGQKRTGAQPHNAMVAGTYTFTLPKYVEGSYRVRVKSAWQSLDPNGGVDASKATNNIQANGGTIIDFTMNVVSPVAETVDDLTYNEAGTWTIPYFCTQETTGEGSNGRIAQLIDCDPTTYYHSSWASSGSDSSNPHFFVLDLGETQKVSGFAWTPRQKANSNNGRWTSTSVFATDDAEAFKFTSHNEASAYATEHAAEARVNTLTAIAGTPAETAMFSEPVDGRYLLFIVNGNAGYSCAAELGLYIRKELTLAQVYPRRIAEIDSKLKHIVDLANLYAESCPAAASMLDLYAGAVKGADPKEYIDSYDNLDEVLANTLLTPIENVVVAHFNANIGKDDFMPYNVGHDCFLAGANSDETSFVTSASVFEQTKWTTEAGANGGEFCFKSANGKYIGTPTAEGNVTVVASKDEAGFFTVKAADGYLHFVSVAQPECMLAANGSVAAVSILTSGATAWQIPAYTEVSEENPRYVVFESKRTAGKYLADHAEQTESKQGTVSYGMSGLYRVSGTTPESGMIWQVTPGYREGSYRIKNYVTKKYLVNLASYCDVTSESPVDMYLIPLSDGGYSISTDGSKTNQTSIDANGFNDYVGFWTAGDQGTTWYQGVLDPERAEDGDLYPALVYYLGTGKIAENAIRNVEKFRNTLPGSDAIVEEAVEGISKADDEESINAIVEGVKPAVEALVDELINSYAFVTMVNNRRESLDQNAILASVEVNDSVTVLNTVKNPVPASMWFVFAGENEGEVIFQNAITEKYIGVKDNKPAFVDEEEAAAFNITVTADGTVNVAQAGSSNLLNLDTNGNNLVFYSVAGDAGSQWHFGTLPVCAEITEEIADTIIKWDGIEGSYSNGKALTSFSITLPYEPTATELGYGFVASINLEDYTPSFVCMIMPEDMTYDAETKTLTYTLEQPITETGIYYAAFSSGAFSMTDAEGNLVYTPDIYSDLVVCFYVPDVAVDLTVTPENGECNAVETINMWIEGAETIVNEDCTESITITKNLNDFLSYTAEEISEQYDEATGSYFIDLKADGKTEEAIYTLTVPEGFFYSNNGRNKLTTVVWDVYDGIVTVTVEGESQTIYDLQGRRLNRASRGINIIDGVKTLIRK